MDGQVLVYHDLIGYGVDRVAKFVKQYTKVDNDIQQSITQYLKDVKEGAFPEVKHTYSMKEETLQSLYGGVH